MPRDSWWLGSRRALNVADSESESGRGGMALTEPAKEWTKRGMDISERGHHLCLSFQHVEAAVESIDMRNSA